MNGNEEIEKWWCFPSLIFPPTSFSITAQQLQHACLRMDSRHAARKIVLSYSAPQTCRRTFLTPFRSSCSTPKWQENEFASPRHHRTGRVWNSKLMEKHDTWHLLWKAHLAENSGKYQCVLPLFLHTGCLVPRTLLLMRRSTEVALLCFPLNVASTALNLTNSGGGQWQQWWQIKSLPWMSVAQTNIRWWFWGVAAHSHGAACGCSYTRQLCMLGALCLPILLAWFQFYAKEYHKAAKRSNAGVSSCTCVIWHFLTHPTSPPPSSLRGWGRSCLWKHHIVF